MVLHHLAVYHFGAGPAFWAAKYDHRPARPPDRRQSLLANLREPIKDSIERHRHLPVHVHRFAALNEEGLVSVADEQLSQFVIGKPGQHGRIGDLVAIEMQDWQDHSVASWIDELIGMPRGRKRASLSLSVADHAGHDQIRIVERRAIGVHKRIA